MQADIVQLQAAPLHSVCHLQVASLVLLARRNLNIIVCVCSVATISTRLPKDLVDDGQLIDEVAVLFGAGFRPKGGGHDQAACACGYHLPATLIDRECSYLLLRHHSCAV